MADDARAPAVGDEVGAACPGMLEQVTNLARRIWVGYAVGEWAGLAGTQGDPIGQALAAGMKGSFGGIDAY